MSVRVHAIAKEVGKTSKEIIEILKERGYDIKSASSTLDNITAESLIEELKPAQNAEGTDSPVDEPQTESQPSDETGESEPKVAESQKAPIVKSKADLWTNVAHYNRERIKRGATVDNTGAIANPESLTDIAAIEALEIPAGGPGGAGA